MINEEKILEMLHGKDDAEKKVIALDFILGSYQQVMDIINGIYDINIERIFSNVDKDGSIKFT
jgi:hypothetical protein